MSEGKNEEKHKIDRSSQVDEALLIRPSGAAPITSMDQLAYNSYNPYYNPGGAEEGFNVREVWRKVRKRKWLIVAIVVMATTLITIESFRTKSMYQSSAKVAISKDNATLMKFGDAIFETNDSERIQTDLLLLRTYPLLAKVAVRLQLDQNPRFLEIGDRKTVFEALMSISSKFKGASSLRSETQKLDPVPPQVEGILTTEEIDRLAPYVATINGNLYVGQIPETRAIEISFTHTDPAIAALVANGVAQVFVDESFENKTSRINKSATWLDRTTRELMAKVQQAEQELASYGNYNDIFNTEKSQSNLVTEKLSNLYGEAIKAETDRKIKQSLYEEVRQGRVAQLPDAFSDPRTVQWQTELGKLQLQYAQLITRFGPENPRVVETQQQIAELERQINQSTVKLEDKLKADFDRSFRDERLIKESLEEAKSEAVQQNQASIKFNLLKQNVDTTKALYNDFLQKTNQANIEKAQQANDLRIIEPARVPNAPKGPNRLRAILVGLLLSLVGGVGLALLLEYLDNTVKSIEDVARAAQLPTLALIPSMNNEVLRAVEDKAKKKRAIKPSSVKASAIGGLVPRGLQPNNNKLEALGTLSNVVEAYRMLRTSVLLSTAGTPPKTILITSSQPGEGKTTTAVNTAISLAQLGASVLLIDSDLRRPAVHKAFKIPHTRGISTYLSSNTPIENLIIKLPIPNLSVLPCGPIPPNPAELISSDRMKELLRKLAEQYDHILIDSPPLVSVTDPVILSTMVDGSILVVHSGRSTRDLVRRARQELAGVGAKIFGVVLNNVNVKREGYDDYYYYRHYSSYGDSQKRAKAG
jgi:capsular exopolysaccharide synthesis family protein